MQVRPSPLWAQVGREKVLSSSYFNVSTIPSRVKWALRSFHSPSVWIGWERWLQSWYLMGDPITYLNWINLCLLTSTIDLFTKFVVAKIGLPEQNEGTQLILSFVDSDWWPRYSGAWSQVDETPVWSGLTGASAFCRYGQGEHRNGTWGCQLWGDRKCREARRCSWLYRWYARSKSPLSSGCLGRLNCFHVLKKKPILNRLLRAKNSDQAWCFW